MRNVTFIGGPLHNKDLIVEDDAFIYKAYGNLLNENDLPITQVEYTYEETRPGSNIFKLSNEFNDIKI